MSELYRPYIRLIIMVDPYSYCNDIGITNPDIDLINKIRNTYTPIIINRYPDEFDISCSIETGNIDNGSVSNITCEVSITNLSSYIKFQMLNKHYSKLKIQAGYLGQDYTYDSDISKYSLSTLFSGTIAWIGTTIEQRSNVITKMIGLANISTDTASIYNTAFSVSFSGSYNCYQLLRELVQNSNNPDFILNQSSINAIELTDEVGSVNINNINQILSKYSTITTYDFENSTLYDIDFYMKLNSSTIKPTEDNTIEINENTGLIGIPTLETGSTPVVKFDCLFNPALKLYNFVKINNYDIQMPTQSDPETALTATNVGNYLNYDGYYKIVKINYDLETRGSNFKQSIEASPYNIFKTTTGQ